MFPVSQFSGRLTRSTLECCAVEMELSMAKFMHNEMKPESQTRGM